MTLSRCSLERQSGLTLLELLVALLVLGLLVVGLTLGVRAGLSMWGAQSRRLGETAELDAGARVLRILLRGFAAPLPGNVRPGSVPTIEASSDRLVFVGDLPTGLGTTRRANITIELVRDRLVLRWTPRRHELSTAPEPEPIETELIHGVEHLDFAYWASPAPNQPASWLAQLDTSQFPELIRVRLTFPKGDRRRWPDLIAATLRSR
jgi:general secretion pathway protein J